MSKDAVPWTKFEREHIAGTIRAYGINSASPVDVVEFLALNAEQLRDMRRNDWMPREAETLARLASEAEALAHGSNARKRAEEDLRRHSAWARKTAMQARQFDQLARRLRAFGIPSDVTL